MKLKIEIEIDFGTLNKILYVGAVLNKVRQSINRVITVPQLDGTEVNLDHELPGVKYKIYKSV